MLLLTFLFSRGSHGRGQFGFLRRFHEPGGSNITAGGICRTHKNIAPTYSNVPRVHGAAQYQIIGCTVVVNRLLCLGFVFPVFDLFVRLLNCQQDYAKHTRRIFPAAYRGGAARSKEEDITFPSQICLTQWKLHFITAALAELRSQQSSS